MNEVQSLNYTLKSYHYFNVYILYYCKMIYVFHLLYVCNISDRVKKWFVGKFRLVTRPDNMSGLVKCRVVGSGRVGSGRVGLRFSDPSAPLFIYERKV